MYDLSHAYFVWTLSSKNQPISKLNHQEDYLTVVKDIMPEFISEQLRYTYEDKDNQILSLANAKDNPENQATLQFDIYIYINNDNIYCFRCTKDAFIAIQSINNHVDETQAKEMIEKFADKLLKKQ